MGDGRAIGLGALRRIQQAMLDHEAELCALDAAIGDGDHGTNLVRGFNAVAEKLAAEPDQPLAGLLKTTARTLISTVGGAAGPLYGTAFLRAATALEAQGQEPVAGRDVAAAFAAALAGVQARGNALPGEKTMVDALLPAANALRTAVEDGADLPTALDRAAAAARTGMEATIPMLATKGRASYLGERSVGHQDPGATSSYLIVQALADAARASGSGAGGET